MAFDNPPHVITKNNTTQGVAPHPDEMEIGELAVNTFDKKLYTKNAIGQVVELTNQGGGAEPGEGIYIPLAGTTSPDYVVGDVQWQHTVDGNLWGIGVLEGVFDDYLSIGAGSGNAGVTGVSIGGYDNGVANNYFFQGNGTAVMPALVLSDSTNVAPLGETLYVDGDASCVSLFSGAIFNNTQTQTQSLRVENETHLGSLTGGTDGNTLRVTGDADFVGNMTCQGNFTAVGQVFGVGNCGSTEGQLIIGALEPTADNHAARKDYVDSLTGNTVNLTGDQTITGIKTFNDDTNFGNATVGNNLNVWGTIAGLAGGSFTGNVTGSAQPTASGHFTRKDYVDNGLAGKSNTNHTHSNYVTTNTTQTITGIKNFTATGGNSITNLTMNNFVVISAMAGGGTRYVKCDNGGSLFASSTFRVEEGETDEGDNLKDLLTQMQNQITVLETQVVALGGTL
jgi:hypothetical protein